MKIKSERVFVALSGGVDSSVAAALLKKAGYKVTGVFIRGWYPDFQPCNWREDRRDAMRVCAILDIPFLTLNAEREYKREVIDYMIKGYKAGRTPNPDVMCNKYVKFGFFLDFADKRGADLIATGHYAIKQENRKAKGKNQYELRESKDKNKDQSYFLWTLTQKQLKKTLFPVGHLTKSKIRELASRFDLPTAQKKDSQGICFLGEVDLRGFLSHYVKPRRGAVLNSKGDRIGEHDNAVFLTIGQRHGFKVFEKGLYPKPLYVVGKNVKRNTVTVSEKKLGGVGNLNSYQKISIRNFNWIGREPVTDKEYKVRIRYKQKPLNAICLRNKAKFSFRLKSANSLVAKGQSLVVYDGDICLGGGDIWSVKKV